LSMKPEGDCFVAALLAMTASITTGGLAPPPPCGGGGERREPEGEAIARFIPRMPRPMPLRFSDRLHAPSTMLCMVPSPASRGRITKAASSFLAVLLCEAGLG